MVNESISIEDTVTNTRKAINEFVSEICTLRPLEQSQVKELMNLIDVYGQAEWNLGFKRCKTISCK